MQERKHRISFVKLRFFWEGCLGATVRQRMGFFLTGMMLGQVTSYHLDK